MVVNDGKPCKQFGRAHQMNRINEMSSNKLFPAGPTGWGRLSMAVIVVLIWLGIWYLPWQGGLQQFQWIRLGVGLAAFLVPGLSVYGIWCGRSGFEFNPVTFGFVISHLMFAVLGTAGRLFNWSFETIKALMAVMGTILLLIFLLTRKGGFSKIPIDRAGLSNLAALLPVLVLSLLVSIATVQRYLSDDDLTYLAFLNNWQYSDGLDFYDPVFVGGNLTRTRFWLMSVPFAQALLADISGMPGILILSGYYEPFLVMLSVFSWYELAISLRVSPQVASQSSILQLLFLVLLAEYLHPGAPFLYQLSADKASAAFIFAPVFFQSMARLQEDPTPQRWLLFILAGCSLSLTHPIILAYAVMIGGLFFVLGAGNWEVRKTVTVLVVLCSLLLPQILLRFVRVPTAQPTSYDPEVVLSQEGSDNVIFQWEDSPFYGFNPEILAMRFPYQDRIPLPGDVFAWGWLLVPFASVTLAVKMRDRLVARFILAVFILCFLAWFPFTGWILGYFLNGRMLARSVWLFPYGLSAAFLLSAAAEWVFAGRRADSWMRNLPGKASLSWTFLVVMTIFSATLVALFLREQGFMDTARFDEKSRRYKDVSEVGLYLDRRTPAQTTAIGPEALNDLLPGVSSKVKLVLFRIASPANMINFSLDEIKQRKADRETIFSEAALPEEKLALLQKYNIRFIVLQGKDREMFTRLVDAYPSLMKMEKINRYFVVTIDHQ